VSYSEFSPSYLLIFWFGRVKILSNVLRDIDDILPQRDLADRQKTELGEIAQGCRDILKELEDTLDRYQELDLSIKGFGGRSRRVWKRFRWDQKDIDRFRNRINSNVLLFNTFPGRITKLAIPFCIRSFAKFQAVKQHSR
jgi:hypothetical protein